jgi:Uma2 family endonuclease
MSRLTVEELVKMQAQMPDYRMELVDGEILVMSPSGYESDEVATRMSAKLFNWVDDRRLGRVTGSSAGFSLPNSDTRAPDVSFVFAARLRRSPRSFAEIAPDLIVEVKSPTDRLTKLRAKIADFLNQGTRVGILIHPEQQWIEIYQSGQAVITLGNGDVLTIPDLLPGWQVEVSELWSPVFDEE